MRSEQAALALTSQFTSLSRSAVTGAAWTLLSFGAARALTFVSNLVLARLLIPADFGIVSFAMVIIGIFTLVQDLGVTQAIIYSKKPPSELAGTSLTINVIAALLLFGLSLVVAPSLAAFGNQQDVAPVLAVLAVGLIISSVGSTQGALLKKGLAFRRNVIPDVIAAVVAAVVSITLALLHFGPWSLVGGYLARVATASALLWYLSPLRVRPQLRWLVAADLIRYGKHVSLSSVIGFAFMNVDFLLVGHFLGAPSLGVYTIAYTIATAHFSAVNQVITTVAFPSFSRLQDDKAALRRMFHNILSIVVAASIAVGLAVFACAPAFVTVVLGSKWLAAITPLQVLTIFGVLASIDCVFPPAYRAIGRPEVMWMLNLLRLIVLLPLMLLFIRYGIVGVAAAHGVTLLGLAALSGTVLARLLGIPYRSFWQPLLVPLVALAAAATVMVVVYTVPSFRHALYAPLGAAGVTASALATYATVLFSLDTHLRALANGALSSARHALGHHHHMESPQTAVR